MTNSSLLTLDRVTFNLSDGRALFSDLSHTFDVQRTGLVGRNGAGKSVLAALLAGQLAPSAGIIRRPKQVWLLPQQLHPDRYPDVAALTGMAPLLGALRRIEAGSCDEADFSVVGENWTAQQQLQTHLAAAGLGHLHAASPTAQLSGGERTRAALIGAQLSGADFVILDEPTNHLDGQQRELLQEQLMHWPAGLLVISHDRNLLRHMDCMVALNATGLQYYGGNYDFYVSTQTTEQNAAQAQLEHALNTRRRDEAALLEHAQRQQRRKAQGARTARESNQARILLGGQKQRSEQTGGRLQHMQQNRREHLAEQVTQARNKVLPAQDLLLFSPDSALAQSRQVLTLENLRLPFGHSASAPLDLILTGPQRVAICGANGSGKSTLLKVVMGQLAPASGHCSVSLTPVYLDQHASLLDPAQNVLTQLLGHNPAMTEGEARTRLALLGLDTLRVLMPARQLSGGERLKAALACVLYAEQPAQLLLLDEPSNHLDLASLQAVENMLNQYRGALLVVSHDEDFLSNIRLTARLHAGTQGWDYRLV